MFINKINLKYVYYSYYILCLISMMHIFTKTLPILENFFVLLQPLLPLLGIILIFTKKNTHFSIWMILLIILQFLTQSNHVLFDNFIYLFIFYILLKDYNHDEFIKIHFYTITTYTLFLTFCMIIGLISPVEFYTGTDRYRRSLTFGHPNMLAMVLLSIHSCWFYLLTKNYFKHKLLLILSLIVNIALCFFYYDTRTGAISLIFILILSLIFSAIKKHFFNTKIFNNFMNYCWIIPILFFIIDLLLTVIYTDANSLLFKLNGLLTGRLWLQSNAFKNLGLPLFGLGVQFSIGGGLYDYVDAFYIAKIYEYGLLLQLLLIFIISLALRKFTHTNNQFNAFIINALFIIYGLEGFLEKETFSFMICPFILMVLISNFKSKEDDKNDVY